MKKKTSKKMGRPKAKVDIDQLAVFCRLKPTLEDCAAFFKCSPDTIQRAIKRHTKLTFAEFRNQNMVHTRHTLIRNAINRANNGSDTMLIFCLKNLCNWRDRNETVHDVRDAVQDIKGMAEQYKGLMNTKSERDDG